MASLTNKIKYLALIIFLSSTLIINITLFGEEFIRFPHEAHYDDFLCVDCHEFAKKKNKAGFPDEETCKGCHDDTMEVDMASLSDKKPYFLLEFSHLTHSDVECQDCHGDVSKKLPQIITIDDCYKCHKENDMAPTCKDCHNLNRFKPEYHAKAGKWNKRHGYRVKTIFKIDHRFDCNACHTKDACKKCHQTIKPPDHSSFWKIRGHGIKAVINRESCSNCHIVTFCVRCHRSTKPINHRGNWVNTHGRSIIGGHRGSTKRCTVCHPVKRICGARCHVY